MVRREAWDYGPSGSAEFPNDNPSLHEGVSWVCLSVCGPVKPVARPRAQARGVVQPTPVSLAVALSVRAEAEVEPVVTGPVEAHDGAEVAHVLAVAEAVPDAAEDQEADDLLQSAGFDEDVAWVVEQALGEQGGAQETRDPPTQRLEAAAPIAAALPAVSEPAPERVDAAPELIPERVLGPLLERLDLELTPRVAAAAIVPTALPALDDVLELDAISAGTRQDEVLELDALGGDVSQDGLEGFAFVEEALRETLSPPAIPVAVDPPTAPDAYDALVGALVEVALGSGATRAAAALPALLDGSSDLAALPDEAQESLVRAGVADRSSGRIMATETFLGVARAWRQVLRGETDDLAACGTSTLDGWGADLLKALGVGHDGKTDVRRELRRRGVAAFGMLLAA